MPHCILEYSNNIVDQPDFRKLLLEVHEFLVSTGQFKLADIKSRVLCHDIFVIGDGASDRAFVTMNVCMLGGRDDSVKTTVSKGVLQLLGMHFPRTFAEKRCSITARITDIHRDSYGKMDSFEA